MKKLITLLLVLTGMVTTASAAKIYINVSNPGWWANDYTVTAISFDGGTTKSNMDAAYKYGYKFRVAEIPSGKTSCIIYRHTRQTGGDPAGAAFYNDQTINFSGTADVYKSVTDGTVSDFDSSVLKWNYMTFRQNIIDKDGNNGNTWNEVNDNSTSHPDNNTFTFELTKTQINNSSNKSQNIRFRLRNGDVLTYNDAGDWVNDRPQIYPTAPTLDDGNGNIDGESLAIAGNTTTYYHNTDNTDWYWEIAIPSYDYEKIKITAQYENTSGDSYRWKISADAYVTKEVSATYDYATFGLPVAYEFTTMPSGVKAYTLTANASSKAISKFEKTTAVAANEGVLLENTTESNQTVRAKVLASADASASNDLHAYTGTGNITQPGGGNTYYILGVQDEHVGFYKVNTTSGNPMGANTAYLSVSGVLAREFFALDDESTGIEAVKQEAKANGEYYNLAGQRVAQPTKGLYIVNGKKVIMK